MSYKHYNDLGGYRSRSGGITLPRNSSTSGSAGITNYRPSYSSTGSITRVPQTKSYKFTCNSPSSGEKSHLNTSRSLSEDISSKSSLGERSSVLQKYTYNNEKVSERPSSSLSSSVVEKYGNRVYTGLSEKNKEAPDSSQRHVSSTFSTSGLRGNYGSEAATKVLDKKEHQTTTTTAGAATSFRTARSSGTAISSSRSSRDSSPEITGTKAPSTSFTRSYSSRMSNYGRNGSSTEAPVTTKFTNSSRFATRNITSTEKSGTSVSYFTPESLSPSVNVKTSSVNKNEKNVLSNEIQTCEAKLENNKQDKIEGKSNEHEETKNNNANNIVEEEKITVVTRGTSPGPPASSSFVRIRRADAARTIQKEIIRVKKYVETKDAEMQSDRMDDTARYSKYASGNRVWSYLDKVQTSSSYSRNYLSPSTSSSRINNFGYTSKSQSSTSSVLNTTNQTTDKNHLNKKNNIPLDVNESKRKTSNSSNSSSSSSGSGSSNVKRNCSPSKIEINIPLNCKREANKTEIVDDIQFSPEHENPLKKRETSVSSVTSSASSPSSSRRESLSRTDLTGITSLNGCQSISHNAGNSNSSAGSGGGGAVISSHQRQTTRNDSSDGSLTVSMPTGKSKSTSSNSLTNHNAKIKTPTLNNSKLSSNSSVSNNSSKQNNSSGLETRGKPPVPKTNDNSNHSSNMKSTGSSSSGVTKYVNKDFRKSALNMPDASDNGNIKQRKRMKNNQRSVSTSSQDSESNNNEINSTTISKSSQIPRKGTSSSRSESKSPTVSRLLVLHNLRSNSKSPPKRITNISSVTSSHDENSETSSSESSSQSDDDEDDDENDNSQRNRKKNKSKLERKNRQSVSSSRTSVLLSSADELSISTDKPPRSPSIPKSKCHSDKSNKSEEAKSFLIRTLTPVTNIFKSKDDEMKIEDENEHFDDSKRSISSKSKPTTKSISKNLSKNSNVNKSKNDGDKVSINTCTSRYSSSGEKPWWLDSNSDNIPEEIERLSICQDDISQDTTVSITLSNDDKSRSKMWHQDSNSNDQSLWINHDEIDISNSPEIKKKSTRSSYSNSKSNTSGSCSKRKYICRKNSLKHQQSGERAWWLSEDPSDVPEGIEVYPTSIQQSSINMSNDDNDEVDNNSECLENVTFSRSSVNKIKHVDSGEKAWWMDSNSNIPEGIQKINPEIESNGNSDDSEESFERLDIHPTTAVTSSSSVKLSNTVAPISPFSIAFPTPSAEKIPLGDRASPEGIENPPDPPDYDNIKSPYNRCTNRKSTPRKRPSTLPLFIGNLTNIDDLLGEIAMPPRYNSVMSRVQKQETIQKSSDESSECEEIDAAKVIIHDSTPKTPVIHRRRGDTQRPQPDGYIPLDDTALQLYKDGDYGAYLDLEASISEQQEEFEGFQTNRKNSIVLRTQLSVRVHTIIEKLLNSEGRELRRALFSLKQIFQEDKDLVHEFVQNDGLACLIKVGNEADQNYQNYILRALGQVMLYVDGMNGVMEHGQTVQWLYTLIASRFRLVVKTALKLLLVFIEYVETNSLLLVRAVRSVDTSRGMIPWTNVMKLLKDYDAADTELLIYATTLVNKCLNGIPDQDTYYDQVDCLEEQGIEGIIQRYMSKQGTDLDLLRQFQIYEAVLHHEDGNDRGSPIKQLDDNIRKTLRSRKSLADSNERRKSRRHSTGTSPFPMSLNARLSPRLNHTLGLNTYNGTFNSSLPDDDDESSSSQGSQGLGDTQLNGSYKENKDDVGVTPALRRRRERAERQRSFIREQQEATATMKASNGNLEEQEGLYITNGLRYTNGTSYERNNDSSCNKISRGNSRKDLTPLMNVANKLDSEEKKPWYGKSPDEGVECDEGNHTDEDEDRRVLVQMKREGTVKDLTQKLAAQNLIPSSPVEDKVSRIGDMSGLISKAKEGLAKSKSKADILKSPTSDNNLPKFNEIKKSENELHWEELVKNLKRPLSLCDLDFTDLNSDDEIDVLSPVNITNGVPPPPPPMVSNGSSNGIGNNCTNRAPPPPPFANKFPPPFPNGPPPLFGINLKSNRSTAVSGEPNATTVKSPSPQAIPKKNKKTVKLFWKEVRDDPIILSRLDKNSMIWDELLPIPVDTQKLEHLFESRAKDLITKKQQEMNKNKEIIVLDPKRSNAINIGMTKLPPPRSIKTAILKMDATIMNREGIEKLLTMLPTEEERSRIQEAQAANPDLPLGSAEQFLLTLASISELPARLKLWAFKLDFENSEKEIADPLMDLKQGMETLRVNKTFRGILSTLLSIGIFLNGNEVKGFQLEYLTKVPEVKDTVHKHSLLHHLCHMVMEKFPDSTDLYSEIGAITRASKVDFDELALNINKIENECKASWDHLKLIAKHDGSTMMKVKMSDFLTDCAERIIVLNIVHRRIINRFYKFILWLGVPLHRVQDSKPNEFCRILSEFALEYRTTRERVIQQLEKKANHRERNKTRGKMITEVGKFRTKEDRADAELRQLLGSDISDVESIHGTLPWRRQRKEGRTSLGPIRRDEMGNGNVTDGDDELLESLVKTATKSPTRTTPRERKRTRHADLRRTLKNGLSEEEKKHIAAYIKGY